jgi:hypothetical protein
MVELVGRLGHQPDHHHAELAVALVDDRPLPQLIRIREDLVEQVRCVGERAPDVPDRLAARLLQPVVDMPLVLGQVVTGGEGDTGHWRDFLLGSR